VRQGFEKESGEKKKTHLPRTIQEKKDPRSLREKCFIPRMTLGVKHLQPLSRSKNMWRGEIKGDIRCPYFRREPFVSYHAFVEGGGESTCVIKQERGSCLKGPERSRGVHRRSKLEVGKVIRAEGDGRKRGSEERGNRQSVYDEWSPSNGVWARGKSIAAKTRKMGGGSFLSKKEGVPN